MKKMFFAYGFVIPVIVVILDQWSKIAVLRSFDVPLNICEIGFARGAYQHNILPFLDFSLLCNQGISWGLLQGDSSIKRWGLTIFAFAMCIVLLYSLTRVKDRLNRFSIALIIGGAIGNGIDRALFGAVTDFIDVSKIDFFGLFHFRYVFNIADSAITCGVIGLLLAGFLIKPDEDAAKTAKS